MAITQVASYTPTDRVPQAFSLSSPAALEINNQTTMRLVVSVGRGLQDTLYPGDHRIYNGLNNLATAPTWLLVSPDDQPDSVMLSGFLGVTSYGASDALPAAGSYQPGTFTVPTRLLQDGNRLFRGLNEFDMRADFLANGDGFSDDGPAIRAACSVLNVIGGGILTFGPGVFKGSLGQNAENNTYQAVGFFPGNVLVRGGGMNVTTIKLADNGAQNSHVLMNWHIQSGGDENITLEDLTVDGNAQNQSMPAGNASMGLKTLRVRNLRCVNVRFKDVYGQANAGGGEGFHVTFDLGTDAMFVNCEVVGTTANTATGFSANQSTNVTYLGCTARSMGFGHGFTAAGCIGMTYVNCYSYLNGSYGFNVETSFEVRYVSCRAGGAAVNMSSYPYTPGQSLGNTSHGFVVLTTVSLAYIGCLSAKNGGSGLFISTVASGSGVIQVVGGEFSNNGTYGISAGFADVLAVHGHVIFSGNTTAAMRSASIDHPASGLVSAPAVPASTTALVNPYCVPVAVAITGGTVSQIQINGMQVTGTGGTYYLQPGNSITLVYTVAPSWSWVAMG